MNKEEMIEEIKKMTVVELADLVKAIEEEFGVSAVAAAAPAAGGAAGEAAAEENKQGADQELIELAENVQAIKEARSHGDLSENSESDEAKNEGKYIRRERYCGEYKRSFYVGEYLKQEDIKAKFEHGILTLCIPKKQAVTLPENKYIAIE